MVAEIIIFTIWHSNSLTAVTLFFWQIWHLSNNTFVFQPNKCSCDNIEVAAEVCGRQGIITDWRQKIPECAIQCPPGQVYQECGDSCARTCEDLSMRPDCFPRCVEGCNCAPGTTMDESGRCIPIEECKCRIKNIVYPPGFQYLKNNTALLYDLRRCLFV